jgi:hypothetical protein
MGVNRFSLIVGKEFKGQVDAFEMDKYAFGTARTFQEFLTFSGVTFVPGRNDTDSCRQLHWVPYSDPTTVEKVMGGSWKLHPEAKATPGVETDTEADALLAQAANPNLQEKKPTENNLRQPELESMTGGAPWAGSSLLMPVIVVAMLFVMFSNDSVSLAIRRRFRSKAQTNASK